MVDRMEGWTEFGGRGGPKLKIWGWRVVKEFLARPPLHHLGKHLSLREDAGVS